MTKPAIPLSAAPRELMAKYGQSPSYRALYTKVIDGQLPATQLPTGRYVVDLSVIAEKLGLTARIAA
jgi:hypothetical protein